MANERLDGVLSQIRKLVEADQDDTQNDGELLLRFVQQHDEAAFAALVRRHGPLVLGVCKRVLRHVHDCEDACQATFLILARRASSIRKHSSLSSWLHGVAYRVACNLQRTIARRHARERAVRNLPPASSTDFSWREVCVVLDQELHRLPEQFQAPLLLCYLEGKTRDEAAQELGWSLSTLRGRLERGRELLRGRLARRGLTLSGALFASLLTQNASSAALPPALELSLVKGAMLAVAGQTPTTGIVSARVAALAAGVLKSMVLTKLKIVAVVALAACFLGLGTLSFFGGSLTAQAPGSPKSAVNHQVAVVRGQDADDGPPGGKGQETPADAQARARQEAESRLNLKKLALAMHNYHDVNGHFPAPALYASDQPGGGNPPVGGGGGLGGPMGGGGPPGMMPPGGSGMRPPGGVPSMPGMGGGRPGAGPTAPSGMPGAMGPGGMGRPGRGGLSGPGMGPAPGAMMGGMMAGMPGGAGLGGAPPSVGQGKALLSWRVAVLPFLGEDELYRQFKLDEAWDGPHNSNLLKRMPKVYAPPGLATAVPGTTFYQVFVGEHAGFEKHQALSVAHFLDGTSNTLLIVEGGSAVPWTKPEDLHYAADEPLPQLGGLFPGIFNAAFADGSVSALWKKGDPDMLRKAITRDDGEVFDHDKIKAPTSPRALALRQQNERLKQDIERIRGELDSLKREMEVLQETDAESDRLRKENQELEQLLRKTRQEAQQLKDHIQRLKQSRDKPPVGNPGL
jgi:RNA polymerase sigma factor (sigma-70 family)